MTETEIISVINQGDTRQIAEMLRNAAAAAIEGLANTEGESPDDVIEEIRSRALAACELFASTPLPPAGPLAFDPEETSKTAILRRVARLRAGVSEPGDPNVDPAELADTLEKQSEYRDAVLDAGWEMLNVAAMMCGELQSAFGTLEQQELAKFHAAKQLPEASNPDSEVADVIRQVARERRAHLGRSRPSGPKRRRWPKRR